ncbi:hypothetical protein PAMP_000106 [Pampus punctatissimus]
MAQRSLGHSFVSAVSIISLGTLLFLNHQTSSGAVNGSRRCISSESFNIRVNKLKSLYPTTLSPSDNALTCQQAAKTMQGDMSNRSLSPWKYR